MPFSISGGWRAFSLLIQTAIGVAQPVDTFLQFSGDPAEPEPNQLFMNDEEVNGELVADRHKLVNRKLEFNHSQKATPHAVGLFAAMVLGEDTISLVEVGVHEHLMKLNKTVEMLYRTMDENDGGRQIQMLGIACNSLKLSGKNDDFVEMEAGLIGRGDEAVNADGKPSDDQEAYLCYGDVQIFKGGTYDGVAVTGGTEISAELKSFNIEISKNAGTRYQFGDSSGNVGAIRRGNKAVLKFEAEIEFEDQSHRNDMLAGAEAVWHIPMTGVLAGATASFAADVVLPRVIYKAAKKGVDEGILKINGEFGVLADSTHGPIHLRVVNNFATSYAATA